MPCNTVVYNRFCMLSMSAAILLIAACSSLRVSDAGRIGERDWLTEGGSASRTNAIAQELALPLEKEWEFNAGGGFGPGGALVSGEHVYVYTRRGEVQAVSAKRGKKEGVASFGESVNGTPAIRRTTIFVPSAWGAKNGVVAHNLRSGSADWKYECPPVDEGILLTETLAIFSDARSTLHAVDMARGTAVWHAELDAAFAVSTTPLLANRAVVVANDHGGLYAFDAGTGRELWRTEAPGPIYSTPAADGDILVVGTTRGIVVGVNVSDGGTRWTFDVGDALVKFASPAIGDDRAIIGASDGSVRALDVKTGSLVWTWHGDAAVTAAPLVAGSQVYFGTMGKMVYAVNALTGHELWSAEVRGRVKSAPTIHGNAVFILSEPRYLYRFASEAEAYAMH